MHSANDSRTRFIPALRALLVLSVVCAALLSSSFAWSKYGFVLPQVGTDDELDEAQLTADKPLVVHVWSPECPHCQRQMPYFAGFYKKVDLDSVNVVSIAVDCNEREAQAYVDKKNLAFPVLLAKGGSMGDDYYKKGWPTTFVFAPGGKYVGYCDTSGPSYINEMLALIEKASK
jgi:thiol-disulfide isomerase/thioredoxin